MKKFAPLPPLRPDEDLPPLPRLEELPTSKPEMGEAWEIQEIDVNNLPPLRITIRGPEPKEWSNN